MLRQRAEIEEGVAVGFEAMPRQRERALDDVVEIGGPALRRCGEDREARGEPAHAAGLEEDVGDALADLADGLPGQRLGSARVRDVLVEPLDGDGELLVDRLERPGQLGGHARGDDPARRQPF